MYTIFQVQSGVGVSSGMLASGNIWMQIVCVSLVQFCGWRLWTPQEINMPEVTLPPIQTWKNVHVWMN